MQETHSGANGAKIYMVARVFNVNSNNIGIKVYVDPERLRLSGGLLFRKDKYSVVPGTQ